VKRAALALLFFSLGGCHTPDWRVHEIHEEIEAANAPRRDAAVKSALEANHATLANVTPTTIMFRSDMNQCVDAEVVVDTAEKQVLVAPCNALRNAIFSGGAVEAKTEDGSASFLLVGAEPLAGDSSSGFLLANGANGELYVIRPHMNVVRKRKIWREGTCNYMPSPVEMRPSARMFVIPPAVVRTVDVTYEGDDTEVICDRRVE
jgi:hypothetical protein